MTDKIGITSELLTDLKERAEKAMPGPWAYGTDAEKCGAKYPDTNRVYANLHPQDDHVYGILLSVNHNLKICDTTAAYIAAANPTMILELIAELEYWQGYADVLEKEKSAYYREFDRLAKELGVFEKTDPGNPETFRVFAEIFDQLKKEANWLAAKANDAGNCLDRKCPQTDFPANKKLYYEKCVACWREAARKAVSNEAS